MRLLAPAVFLATLVADSYAYSLNKNGLYGLSKNNVPLTQKEVTRMTTRRDTIRMPSQTPMVPWKVRNDYVIYEGI